MGRIYARLRALPKSRERSGGIRASVLALLFADKACEIEDWQGWKLLIFLYLHSNQYKYVE